MRKQHKLSDDMGKTHSPHRSSEKKEEGKEEGEERKQEKIELTKDEESEIDQFIQNLKNGPSDPPEIPNAVLNKLLSIVEKEVSNYGSKWSLSLLDSIDRLSKLSSSLPSFSSDPKYIATINRSTSILQRSMSFLEEEFRSLLEDSNQSPTPPPYCSDTVDKLQKIAAVMTAAGYESECYQAFSVARRHAFDAALAALGFEKLSLDDVQKMQWESLESQISTWIQAFKHSISVLFSNERDLCESVFSGRGAVAGGSSLFLNLARGVVIQLLNFAEAVAATTRSAEKLFKALDMYETLRDALPEIDALFPAEATDLKSEISSARSRLGEAAVAIFCDLETSIKSDTSKSPVPGGAVHPLTRYVINYLKYACEYRATLDQLFAECNKNLATELVQVMDMLDANLETKSKLYKDSALSNIFMMNNGRYIVKKIKESAEIHEVVGDNLYKKRSADLRQYHNNYKRETWAKVLGCLRDEGVQVKGSVSKPVLKERLKSFNGMMEEIHKTQSTWVVSDEQMQSELRVSVAAVVVPAYRSFLGRYRQYLNTGRQTEKYIKFGPEDLEAYIDELFDGGSSSHGHGHGGRRRS